MTNYHAAAIDIVTSEKHDFRQLCINIAKTNPSVLVKAAGYIPWQAEVRRCLASKSKIDAIKLCRTLTGMSLKDAKDAVERLMGEQ